MPGARQRQVAICGISGLIGGMFYSVTSASKDNNIAPVRVLVVDDYPDSAESVAWWLELDGFETRTARDGTEALESAMHWHPHVCLVDLQMPKIDGFEVARKLREQPWGKQTVLIAHTGCTTREVRDQARAAGFDKYFTKPTEPQALLQFIQDQTAKRGLNT
jgi:CheY-like chemotaxis protein